MASERPSFLDWLKSVLSSPTWTGIVGILTVLGLLWSAATWIIQVESQFRQLREEATEGAEIRAKELDRFQEQVENEIQEIRESVEESTASTPSDTNLSTPFSEVGRVRCPGGGHLLFREVNRRAGHVEFNAPEGNVIVMPAHIRVLSDNHGGYSPVEYMVPNTGEDPTGVKASMSCDPPNFPGAPGGWMEIELYGEYRQSETN